MLALFSVRYANLSCFDRAMAGALLGDLWHFLNFPEPVLQRQPFIEPISSICRGHHRSKALLSETTLAEMATDGHGNVPPSCGPQLGGTQSSMASDGAEGSDVRCPMSCLRCFMWLTPFRTVSTTTAVWGG